MRNVTILLLLARVDCNDGVASYCQSLVEGLREQGERVVLVSGPVTELYGSETRRAAINAAVLEWVVLDELRASRPQPSVIRAISNTIRKHAVDVIGLQGLSLLPLAFGIGKFAGLPVVANFHAPTIPSIRSGGRGPSSVLKRLAYRFITNAFSAQRFIAISKDVVTFYREFCTIPEKRVAYIPMGIDTTMYRPPTPDERKAARDAFSLREEHLVCVLPGRLNFQKGHDIVVDAVRDLRRDRPDLRVVCLFPGAGDSAGEIEAYALHDEADATAFRFLGFLTGDGMREAYWAADIAVLPSRFESFALVIPEAMLCGCVPIRTPSGGWEDQIDDGSNGFVIPFDDSRTLGERIARLADPELRGTMRERAIAYATVKFDRRRMLAATAELYRNVARPPRLT